MPLDGIILNLSDYDIIEISGYKPVVVEARFKQEPACPHCGSKTLRNKGNFFGNLIMKPWGEEPLGCTFILVSIIVKIAFAILINVFLGLNPGAGIRKHFAKKYFRGILMESQRVFTIKWKQFLVEDMVTEILKIID